MMRKKLSMVGYWASSAIRGAAGDKLWMSKWEEEGVL
jgi:hypothetical protein